ncbi:MAG: PAS domain S-box protein [Bacteroidia bacterium]|nr:PAS domain S-box protein [Bacteroidia bacterium]
MKVIFSIFDYLADKISYVWAVTFFTVSYSVIIAFHGFFFVTGFDTFSEYELKMISYILVLLIPILAFLHYTENGLFKFIGLPGFSKDVIYLNKNYPRIKRPAQITDNELIRFDNALQKLALRNTLSGFIYSQMLALIVTSCVLTFPDTFKKFLIIYPCSAITALIYTAFTFLIGDFVIGPMRIKVRQLLVNRNIDNPYKAGLSIRLFALSILAFILFSMIVLSFFVMKGNKSMIQVIIFVLSTFISTGLGLYFYFYNFDNTLKRITKATYDLANKGKGILLPESYNKEIIDLVRNYNTAAIEIYNIRLQLEEYNILLEKTVAQRTAELRFKNEELITQKAEILSKNEEIRSQSEQLELSNKELEKLSIVARETDNSIVIADENGKIEWVNAGFTKLFGYTLDEFTGKFGSTIVESSSNPEIVEAFRRCVNDKSSVVYISSSETKSGHVIWTQTTLTPVINDHGGISRLVAIDTDISKLKAAEEAIRSQNEIIQSKNNQITDSINYAQKIQQAILPSESRMMKYFSQLFIFYRPKDIVSGDFYWVTTVNISDRVTCSRISDEMSGSRVTSSHPVTMMAVADCTGHGVPGGFMSMIGYSLLNEIVNVKKILNLADILSELDKSIRIALQQNEDSRHDDGMAISILCYDRNEGRVVIACAGQYMYLVLNRDLTEIADNILYIGDIFAGRMTGYKYESQMFSSSQISFIYMFSDGYMDQFGGPKNQKFMAGRFKKLIGEISNHDIKEQKEILETTFNQWKGDNLQTDDVLVVGLKF